MAISLQIQPVSYSAGYTNSRSPVIYRYTGCDINNTYYIRLLYDYSSTGLTTVYTEITRVADSLGNILVDVSDLLQNICTKKDYFVTTPKTYFRCDLMEYSGSTYVSYLSGSTSEATLGYSTFGYGIYNDINQSNVFNYTEQTEHLLSSIPENTPYTLPNDTYTYYYMAKTSTNYKLSWYETDGTFKATTYAFSVDPIEKKASEITLSVPTLFDKNRPYTLEILSGSTVEKTYIFKFDYDCNTEVKNVRYLNKFGFFELMPFTGKIDTELSIGQETFKHNKVNWDSASYANYYGTYHKNLTNAKNKISMNTGWVTDEISVKMQEFFLSPNYLLQFTKTDTPYYLYTPLMLIDQTIKYKTIRYDNMYNYTLLFEEAVDKINNIR